MVLLSTTAKDQPTTKAKTMNKLYRRCMNYLKKEFSNKNCPVPVIEYALTYEFPISDATAQRIVAEYLR
jgi:hypothetical protein